MRTLRLVAAYPMAFFLAAAYTEGIFLAFAIFCLYFLRRGFWYGAAICAFCATLTRFTGIVLLLPMIWEYGSVTRLVAPHLLGRWRMASLATQKGAIRGSLGGAFGSAGPGQRHALPGALVRRATQLCGAEETGWSNRSSMPLWQSLPLRSAKSLYNAGLDLSTGADTSRPDTAAGLWYYHASDDTAAAASLYPVHAWSARFDSRLADHLEPGPLCLRWALLDTCGSNLPVACPVGVRDDQDSISSLSAAF